MAASKEDNVKKALDNLSEAAKSLSCHGHGGYTVDSSALDVVFIRAMINLKAAIADDFSSATRYDPTGDIYDALPGDGESSF